MLRFYGHNLLILQKTLPHKWHTGLMVHIIHVILLLYFQRCFLSLRYRICVEDISVLCVGTTQSAAHCIFTIHELAMCAGTHWKTQNFGVVGRRTRDSGVFSMA